MQVPIDVSFSTLTLLVDSSNT